ncbi:MAG: hypothetical protein DDT41_01716 [candidate division WS2 bacterium]|nr:hypothetical protein [Candidatus Psychracetigena formicireducens]
MLVNQDNLALVDAAVKAKSVALQNVRIDPKAGEIQASNGYSLYWSSLPPAAERARYPVGDHPDLTKEVLIPATALQKAEKNIPKRPPFLAYIDITSDEQYHYLGTTNLDTTDVVKVRHPKEQFPDIDKVRADLPTEPNVTIAIGVDQLDLLLKIVKQQTQTYIQFEFFAGNKPFMVTLPKGNLSGLIMPVKTE